jgi:hypothetical protein
MVEISDDQKRYLSRAGIGPALHQESLKSFPVIVDWIASDEGKDFISGAKGLFIHGESRGQDAGKLLVRWFILSGYTGAVGHLVELVRLLRRLDWDGDEDVEEFLDSEILCIVKFQHERESPLEPWQVDRVEEFMEKRLERRLPTVFQSSKTDFSWYSSAFRERLRKCFYKVEIRV